MEFISSYYWQQGENASTLLLQQCQLGKTTVFFACVCEGENAKEGVAGGYLSERLLGWFRGLRFAKAVRRPERFLAKQALRLEELLTETDKELVPCGLRVNSSGFGSMGSLLADSSGFGSGSSLSAGSSGFGSGSSLSAGSDGFGSMGSLSAGSTDLEKVAGLAGIFCIGEEFLLFGRGSVGVQLLNRGMVGEGVGTSLEYGKEFWMQQGGMEPGIGLLLATGSFFGNVGEEALQEGLSVVTVLTGTQTEKHLRELGKAGERSGGRNMAAVLFYAREGRE